MDYRRATKKVDIWSIPDVLVVHLNRFRNSGSSSNKTDCFVDYPLQNLDLSSRALQKTVAMRLEAKGVDLATLGLTSPHEPLLYDLFAVDEHAGASLANGHYQAHALNHLTDQWYHFADSKVKEVDAEAAIVRYLYDFSETLISSRLEYPCIFAFLQTQKGLSRGRARSLLGLFNHLECISESYVSPIVPYLDV